VIEGLAGKHVTGVACGFGHTIVALHDGACFAFGWNRDGQCGNGTRNDALVPSSIKGLEGVSAQHASCGGGHSAVISHDGRLLTFGSGSCGQLGHGQTDDLDQAKAISQDVFGGPLASVSCGEEYTIVVSAAREVFGCEP
jgi:alpha-tubulin suppressor-like RCC1 family protein